MLKNIALWLMAMMSLLAGCIAGWARLASCAPELEKPSVAGCFDYQPTSCALMPLEASAGPPFSCHEPGNPCKSLPTFDLGGHFRCPIAASGYYRARAEEFPCNNQTASLLRTQNLPSPHSRAQDSWMHDDSGHYNVSTHGKILRNVDHLHLLDCLQGPPSKKLVFIGDSMMRQLFSHFVHVMRNQSRILDVDFHGHASFTLYHNDSLSWDMWELAHPFVMILETQGNFSQLVSSAGAIASNRSASGPHSHSVRPRVQADFLWAVSTNVLLSLRSVLIAACITPGLYVCSTPLNFKSRRYSHTWHKQTWLTVLMCLSFCHKGSGKWKTVLCQIAGLTL